MMGLSSTGHEYATGAVLCVHQGTRLSRVGVNPSAYQLEHMATTENQRSCVLLAIAVEFVCADCARTSEGLSSKV